MNDVPATLHDVRPAIAVIAHGATDLGFVAVAVVTVLADLVASPTCVLTAIVASGRVSAPLIVVRIIAIPIVVSPGVAGAIELVADGAAPVTVALPIAALLVPMPVSVSGPDVDAEARPAGSSIL